MSSSSHRASTADARGDGVATVPVPPLRVVLLSASGHLGGAERLLVDLVAGMREDDSVVMDVVQAADGPLHAALRQAGVAPALLPWPHGVERLGETGVTRPTHVALVASRLLRQAPSIVRYLLALRRHLRRLQPDIVHTNGFKMHVLGALAAPRGARVVWHLHDFTASRRVMARLLRALSSRCAGAIANSRAVADDARLVLAQGTEVRTVLNAIDLSRFAPDGPRAHLDPAGAGTGDAPVRIGLVATLASWKGHRTFLRALARLRDDATWRAYIVSGAIYQTSGSQASLDDLRAEAAHLGLADRVVFTGFRPDVAEVLRALDVVVHASTRPEPFGLVIAEAMASGRAVVYSAAGGALELAQPEVEGLPHRPGDDADLASQLRRLIGDGALRARLGEAARRAALERFDRRRLAREVADAWRSFAGMPR